MRRIMVLLTVAVVMAAMLAFGPGPVAAQDVDEVFVSGDEVCVVLEIEEEDDGDNDDDDDDDADDEEEVEIECEDIA